MDNYTNIGKLIKKKREEKGYSTRQLAKLCDISHTEISNIEKGQRVKPAILTLKGFEKYLDLDFKKLANAVGYSDAVIKSSDDNIIVTYDKYDKKIQEYESEIERLKNVIIIKSHLGVDIQDYFDTIYKYLKKSGDEELIKLADNINVLLDNLRKYKL